MRPAQIGSSNWLKPVAQRGTYFPRINEIGKLVEQVMLLNHITGLIECPGKHPLPDECHTFPLERGEVNRLSHFNNRADFPLRRNHFSHISPVLLCTIYLKFVQSSGRMLAKERDLPKRR